MGIHADPVALRKQGSHGPRAIDVSTRGVDAHVRTPHHRRNSKPSCDHGGMAGQASAAGDDGLRHAESPHVFGQGIRAHEHHGIACGAFDGPGNIGDDDATCHSRTGRKSTKQRGVLGFNGETLIEQCVETPPGELLKPVRIAG